MVIANLRNHFLWLFIQDLFEADMLIGPLGDYDTSCIQEGSSCLHIASTRGHLELVKYLCERGGEVLLMLKNEVSVCA
jgi:hypothetical protein